MQDELSLLEGRVERAVERLRDLSAERQRLEAELRGLRERIERLESPESAGTEPDLARWSVQRAEVIATLRESIELLQD